MFQWIRYLLFDDLRIINLEGKVAQMSVELEELREAVVLVNKAVDEAIQEIRDLAEQLRVCANKPDPNAAEIETLADTLKATAERLHGAVYPPSSHVDLEP